LSHAKAVEAYREHELKVLEGNSIHVKIDNEMKARAAYYARGMAGGKAASLNEVEKKKSQKVFVTGGGVSESPLENFYASRRSTFENQLREGRATILRNKVASFIFDYNTAEAVLLASCLLINLAGICFDSSRFSATVINMPGRKAEYDSLAFAVICVIFISLIFWIVSLSTDIALVLSPQAVNSCLGGLGKARKGLVVRAQKSLKMGKASGSAGKRLSAKSASGKDIDMDDPNAVKTEINQYALMRGDHMSSKGNTSEAYVLNLKKQHEDDVMLIQELRSQLDERSNFSTSRTVARPQASIKKSFTPVEVSSVESPLLVAANIEDKQANEDEQAKLSSVGNNNLTEAFEPKLEESSPQSEDSSLQSEEKTPSKLSKIEMFKAKMKAKPIQKSSEAL